MVKNMATQTESLPISGAEVDRETDELLLVAEGFVLNAWAVIANRVGLDIRADRDLSVSTKLKLGEQAARFIVGFDETAVST